MLSAKDIESGKILIPQDCRRISIEDYNSIFKNYNLKINDILLTIVGTIGRVAMVDNLTNKYALQRSVAIIRVNSLNHPLFIFYLLQTNNIKKQYYSKMNQSAQGGIYLDSLNKLSFKNTILSEQEKIAKFLSIVDKRIEKQRQLVESLKKYKRGLLFSIFKIDNKTWSSSNLGDLCNITTGKLDANAMCSNGIYRFYTCAKEFYYINDYAFDTEALLISGNGANVGYIHHYNGKFNAYQRTYVLDNFKQNIIYIKYYLETFLHQRIESEKKAGNTPYIVLSTLSNFKIKYPAINEQNLIAKFLSEIDTVIEKHEILLDQILTIKQGLLQQMFI